MPPPPKHQQLSPVSGGWRCTSGVCPPPPPPPPPQDLLDTLPLVLSFWFALGAHEFGHMQAARERGVQLYLPLIVPAGELAPRLPPWRWPEIPLLGAPR